MKTSRTPKNRTSKIDFTRIKIVQISPNTVRYECPVCVKQFTRKDNLHVHCRYQHPNQVQLFGCSHCRRTYVNELDKNRHENIKHPVPVATNQIASATTSVALNSKKRKKQMKRTTTKKRKNRTEIVYGNELSCSYCPKFLSSMSSKLRHEKMHTGDQPFTCKTCSASFCLESTYIHHQSICSSLGLVVWCKFCDFHTLLYSSLENHYRKIHGFQFTSDIEIDFLNLETKRELTSKHNTVPKDGEIDDFKSDDQKSSHVNHSLEEIFRDHIVLVPNLESFESTVTVRQKEMPVEVSKDEETSVGDIGITQSNNTVEEIFQQDDLEPNSRSVEDARAVFSENVPNEGLKNNKLLERETEISQTNYEVEEPIRNSELEPNSIVVEDASAVFSKKVPNEGLKNNELLEHETEISQTNYDEVEEPIRDSDLEPNSIVVEGANAVFPKNVLVPIEGLKNNELLEGETEISQTNYEIEEPIRDSDLEPNSIVVEGANAVFPKNVPIEGLKNNELLEHETEISQTNYEIEEPIRDSDLEPNSIVVEGAKAAFSKNIPIVESENTELPEHETQTSQLNDKVEETVQGDDLEPNSKRVQYSNAIHSQKVPIEALKGNEIEDTMLHEGTATEVCKQSDREAEIPQSNDESEISRNFLKSVSSECVEKDLCQKDSIIDAPEVSAQINYGAENSSSNDPTSRESYTEIPASLSNSHIELKVSPSEADIEPDVSPQDAEITDPVDEKLIKYEFEVAQLDNNLKEIFKGNDFNESSFEFETDPPPCQFIDLTLNEDDESEPNSRIIVIDIDDDE